MINQADGSEVDNFLIISFRLIFRIDTFDDRELPALFSILHQQERRPATPNSYRPRRYSFLTKLVTAALRECSSAPEAVLDAVTR
jgi:hypothetical protein